jgi:hypothetical protein
VGWEWRENVDGKPWRPLPDSMDTICGVIVKLRYIPADPPPWTTLDQIRPGAVFELRNGVLGFKNVLGNCFSLEDGERIHFFTSVVEAREVEARRGNPK